MELNLHEQASAAPVFTGGVSIDNLSWWFWIKAGMGLSLGAILFWVAAMAMFWGLAAAIGIGALLHSVR